MITGDVKSKVDAVWDAFWTGGISNPLEVMEQITYLLFIRRLDDEQTRALNKANMLGRDPEGNPFPIGTDEDGRDYNDLRWSVFKNMQADDMFYTVGERVFPFIKNMRGEESTYAHFMKDARLTIPNAAMLVRVVDRLDKVPMENRDTKGDIYEYLLAKIASAGQNGQFRTPRHIIQLMVEMTQPKPGDRIVDPASGTCGFLVAASEYMRENHADEINSGAGREQFHHDMFHGFDFDNTMLRIGSMNMLLHGIEQPDVRYRDSLAEANTDDAGAYSLILANPPFAGNLDYESTAKDLQQIVKTKKTELLFMALFLRLLQPGGRAAVIVPDGVLFGSSKAHKTLRKILVEDHKLDAVVKLPSGVFKPYAGVSTAILFFTKTDSGGTDNVWFYDVQSDGYSLDDKRTPLLDESKLGVLAGELSGEDHPKNNLPDVLKRWFDRNDGELERPRTEQSFCVPKEDIAAQDYDLSLNRYKEIIHEEVEHRAPEEILDELDRLEKEIVNGMAQLREMLTGGAE
ncbi:type I restriction-modification system methyltransferase subunit [Rhodococcus rhodochrous]|uniref:type I restriction-modification system subunit M n=1 Tax=Rhodococcus rhodochrous TaxID=1829 RepID=UPI0007510337|nr:class I SAM-dependent DNA methyltransferase [Rhodococcus rhodochrous]MDO1483653.1 SAM-dependent DNA methyltransferase [Rhodococcus rhodochrous]SNV09186.1 type I restriction-modification system methyltransferase subunit [Rhodococcus rhodochrous]